MLKYDAQFRTAQTAVVFRCARSQIAPVELDRARAADEPCFAYAHDCFEQGGLAAAARTDDAEYLARRDLQGDVVQDGTVPVPCA